MALVLDGLQILQHTLGKILLQFTSFIINTDWIVT